MKYTLIIQDMDLPSLNTWLSTHWLTRHDDKTGLGWEVKAAVLDNPGIPRPFWGQVDIWITAHAQTHVEDSDNLAGGVKALIDGLRYAEVLREDNSACVRWVGQMLVKDTGQPWVEVLIEEVDGE